MLVGGKADAHGIAGCARTSSICAVVPSSTISMSWLAPSRFLLSFRLSLDFLTGALEGPPSSSPPCPTGICSNFGKGCPHPCQRAMNLIVGRSLFSFALATRQQRLGVFELIEGQMNLQQPLTGQKPVFHLALLQIKHRQ